MDDQRKARIGKDAWEATLDSRVAATKGARQRVREADAKLAEAEKAVRVARERVAQADRDFQQSMGSLHRFLGHEVPPAPTAAAQTAGLSAATGTGNAQAAPASASDLPSVVDPASGNGGNAGVSSNGARDSGRGKCGADEEDKEGKEDKEGDCDTPDDEGEYGSDSLGENESENSKRFRCDAPTCRAKFRRPADLREHEFVSHRNGSFECSLCEEHEGGGRLTTSAHLMVHLQRVHGLSLHHARLHVQPQRDALM